MAHEIDPEPMRAVVVTEPGGSDKLAVQSRPRPQPRAGQLLVQVAASGVNFIDVYQRTGSYGVATPFVLGIECAGRVSAVGAGVDGVHVGDLVATASGSGTHAEFAIIEASAAVPVPDAVTPEIAAAAMLQGLTAHYLINSTYPVRDGDTVLVHAGAGGVGRLLIQLARAKGARVITTVGSAAKVAIAQAAGADEVIRYDEVDDLAAAVRELAPDGVHVAYDGVGQSTFDASLAALRRRGTLALFGAASGPVPPIDPQRLNSGGSLFLTRPTLAHYASERDELVWRSGEVFGAIADGSLTIAIGGRYPLEGAAEAYDDLEGRRTTGKLLIVP